MFHKKEKIKFKKKKKKKDGVTIKFYVTMIDEDYGKSLLVLRKRVTRCRKEGTKSTPSFIQHSGAEIRTGEGGATREDGASKTKHSPNISTDKCRRLIQKLFLIGTLRKI